MSLSEQLAAVLEHNGIASPSEAFPLFDLDQDERISAADLLESCTEVQIKTSLEQVAAWIAHHAQQEDKSFLTLGAWCAALENASGKHVLQSLGVGAGGAPRDRPETSRQFVSSTIAALLEHNGLHADEGFNSFDVDSDGRISLADLDGACATLGLDRDVHAQARREWHRHYNTSGDGFMIPQEWRSALDDADHATVASLQRHASATESEYGRMKEEQDEIIRQQQQILMQAQLQEAEALLSKSTATVHGSLHADTDDNASSTSDSSAVSTPATSAGSGGSFELESEPSRPAQAPTKEQERAAVRIQARARGISTRKHAAVKKEQAAEAKSWEIRKEQAVLKIQARTRGMQVRSMHANSRRNKINASAGQLNKFVSAHSGLEHAVSDDEVRQMKAQHQAAIRIQARQRGNANRRHVQDIKGKKVEEMRAEHAAIIIQKRARGMLARSGSRHGVSTSNRLRGHTPSTHAGTAYSESDFEQDEDDYDDEFEEDVEPQWIGAECDAAAQVLQAFCRTQISLREVALSRSGSEVRRELQRQETITRERDEARQAELEKQRAERRQNETSSVLAVQIDMIEADWAAAEMHRKVLKYATQRLARSIVDDLVEATVDMQEALKAKQERERIRREEEENRGYRKPRIVEEITEYIKNATQDELCARAQLFSASNEWFQQRGQQIRLLQKQKQAEQELIDAEKTAKYIAARRAKVDAIYEEREREKQAKQQQVSALREYRRRDKIELANFVTAKKLAEEARAEEEFKATVALDAQRRRQVILAQAHKERLIEEKQKLHELGVKAARRRVLKEEKKERDFQKHVEALVHRKKKKDEERKKKRENMMVLYDKALQVAEEMRQTTSSVHANSGAKDPNETLKSAIGVYFSDPSNSTSTSKTKKLLGDLMFQQKEGAVEWTEKRVEARLTEIFQWMDKDGTGQVEQSELYGAMQRMGGNVKSTEIEHLLASIDVDGDGQLTLEEFIDFGKSVFAQQSDVSGSKIIDRSRPGTTRLRTATPEMISSNKREREERLEAGRQARRLEEEAKIKKALAIKARYAERQKFVDEAVQAYEKTLAERVEAKDEEMMHMQRLDRSARQRRKQSFDRQWLEQQKTEEQVMRSWNLRRAKSASEKNNILKEEQRKLDKIRSTHETFNYEKAITTEHLVSIVEGKRRMASPGFPVVVAPRESASRVMLEISSVYLAKPRTASSLRPHTSLGFGDEDGSDESAPSKRSGGQRSRTGNRLLLSAQEHDAAHKYFVRFGTKTKLGEKVMPYHRFDRMLHAMKIAPLLLSEADVVNIFNLALGATGNNDVYADNLTAEQFYQAVFHVSEWTGRSFLEMSLLGEQVQESFTNRHDWSTGLRASAYEHPLLSKSLDNQYSGSLSSFAQSSLPLIQGLSGSLSTPLLGFDAPKSKKEYLKLRKHMKVASCTVVKATGKVPDALERRLKKGSKGAELRERSNVLELDSHLNSSAGGVSSITSPLVPAHDSGVRPGELQLINAPHDDALPSVSPSEGASQASSFLDASFSTVADRSLDATTGGANVELTTPNTSLMLGNRMLDASVNALDQPPKPLGGDKFGVSGLPGGGGEGGGDTGGTSRASKPFKFKF